MSTKLGKLLAPFCLSLGLAMVVSVGGCSSSTTTPPLKDAGLDAGGDTAAAGHDGGDAAGGTGGSDAAAGTGGSDAAADTAKDTASDTSDASSDASDAGEAG